MHLLAVSPGTGFRHEKWRSVLHSGIDALMIREKHLGAKALLDLVHRVQDMSPDLPIWVNGRADIAWLAGVGYHASESCMELQTRDLLTSRPLHEPGQYSARVHSSQLLISPIFDVPEKGPAWGTAELHAFLQRLPPQTPRLLALGGITPDRIPLIRHPRLHGAAVIRALWDASDPGRVCDAFRRAWDTSR